ncbi:MAG: DNA polymerase III subunit alpha [Capsulimonadales bacterium]|nr:DNA polymerase III subunit alpha [Capsulimonadales bacterium]
MQPGFAHLNTHSAFSFLDGSSAVETLVLAAAEQGQTALALTDRDSVTGVVSLVKRCAKAGIRPIGGCDLTLEGGHRLTLLMDGTRGWTSLCRILTAAHLRDPERKGPRARFEEIAPNAAGLVCLSGGPESGEVPLLLRRGRYADAEQAARRHLERFGKDRYAIEVTRTLTEGEHRLSERLFALADHLGVPAVATNTVRYARKPEVAAYEAVCRVRLGLAPHEQHADLPFNGERHLKSADEMSDLFRDRPDALENAARLAEQLAPPLVPGRRHLPAYPFLPVGATAFSCLTERVWQGARERYRERLNDAVRTRLIHELETIHELDFDDYFLVCADICREARERKIGHGLRGSAIGSAVAYCLYMSHHDPIAYNVSFERFLSRARAKPPDIDIDFRHDLRDEMMDYVRRTYGAERVANVSNYVTYRGRSLLRDLGKALGFDTADIDRLRELLWHSRGDDLVAKLEAQPELRALGIDRERYGDLFALCGTLAGLPRHLGTHSSGIVVADVPLAGIAPIRWAAKGVTVVALDKDDVEADGVGLLKIDQLSLRALTAVDIAVHRLREDDPDFDYDGRDREDEETFALIRAARTIGVFQLESPAQMALQWRLQASRFDDLIASVALIRPGPLTGKTVDPYVRRRLGLARPVYPLPELEPVLKETYGRIIFQDQVLDVVRIVGRYTPDEADRWLKTMTHARSSEEMERLGVELWERTKPTGMKGKAFERLWRQIKGFSRYGFCHGHALAFADHAQGTAWLLTHHPADFFAAILSVEPCGFWPVATVVEEAKRRGVVVLGPCVNRSAGELWTLETPPDGRAIRCSLAFVREVRQAAKAVEEERHRRGPFATLYDFLRRCCFLTREQTEWLTLSGALDDLHPHRRETLWSLSSLCAGVRRIERAGQKAQAIGQESIDLEIAPVLPDVLPPFDEHERMRWERASMGFSPDAHPLRFYRPGLSEAGVLPCAQLQTCAERKIVTVAGLVLRPHRPPTPSGQVFVFLTLEDETGLAQVTVTPDAYERIGAELFGFPLLAITGTAEPRGIGMILNATACHPLT